MITSSIRERPCARGRRATLVDIVALRRWAVSLVGLAGGCFEEAQGVATTSVAGDSSGASGTADSTSSTAATGGSADVSDDGVDTSTTAAVCEDATFPDRVVERQPVQLYVIALPGVDPTAFNQVVVLPDLQAVVDTESTRVVFLDPQVGLETFAGACAACADGDCTQVVHVVLDAGAPPFVTLFEGADAFSCVQVPDEDQPRNRLLLLSPDEAPDAMIVDTLLTLVAAGWDVDLACPGCGDRSQGRLATALRPAGGVVSDLDSTNALVGALTLAVGAPPTCAWLADEVVPPPLTLADLRVTIDPCAGDEASCARTLAQVQGLADCDANDPDADEFYVLEDAVSEGMSYLGLCEPACVSLRRALGFGTSFTHEYVCAP